MQSRAFQCKALLLQRQHVAQKLCDFRWRHQQLKPFHAWKAFSRRQRASVLQSSHASRASYVVKDATCLDPASPCADPWDLGCWVLRFWHLTTLSSSTKSLQARAASLRLEQRAAAHFLAVALQDELLSKCQLQVFKAWRDLDVEKRGRERDPLGCDSGAW